MDREENEERVLQCPLNICERKFFNNHGAAQHAVDSHRFNTIVFRTSKSIENPLSTTGKDQIGFG